MEVIEQIRMTALRRYGAKLSVFTLSIMIMAWSVSFFLTGFWLPLTVSGFALLLSAILFIRKRKTMDKVNVCKNLDRQYPELCYSTHLLLTTGVAPLEIVQRERTLESLEKIYLQIKPYNFKAPIYMLSFSLILALFSGWMNSRQTAQPLGAHFMDAPDTLYNATTGAIAPGIGSGFSGYGITIVPPAYTGMKSYTAGTPDIKVPEGGKVIIELDFNGEGPGSAHLVIDGQQQLTFKAFDNGNLRVSYSPGRSCIYHWQFVDHTGDTLRSDLHLMEVDYDQPPVVAVSELPEYQVIEHDKRMVPFGLNITDDHGVSAAWIVATVSRGEGEAVKFREEKFSIRINPGKQIKRAPSALGIDVYGLKMAPGDELYFYVMALDNKRPVPLEGRSATYFIAMEDTVEVERITSEGGGVDRMPEYFRSQRQIIIDTEKLISEKGAISKEEFNIRSNSLAHDQRALRLRYGQFLGEEHEDQSGGPEEDESHHDEQEGPPDVLKEFGHEHDAQEAHERDVLDPGQTDVVEGLAHSHDDAEQATFLFASTRVKLKRALSLMWESELHLRTYQPKTALPVEYRILKLLKEVQQLSRIYVERIGFEPTPVNEKEKRLTGKLSDVHPKGPRGSTMEQEECAPCFRLLAGLDNWLQGRGADSLQSVRQTATEVGREMAKYLRENPAELLDAIRVLKKISDGRLVHREEVSSLYRTVRKFAGKRLPGAVPGGPDNDDEAHFTRLFLRHLNTGTTRD